MAALLKERPAGTSMRRLTLDVEDTGPGFPAGAESQVFERFFTTKPAGRGTGLGLWIVRETVAAFGGTAVAAGGGRAGVAIRRTQGGGSGQARMK